VFLLFYETFAKSFIVLGESKRPKRSTTKGAAHDHNGAPSAGFQQPKKDREQFRKALVEIIM